MNLLVSTFILLAGWVAHAQTESSDMASCKTQIELYCQKEKDFRTILKCLADNHDKLSMECKQETQRLIQATRQTTPPGGPLGALAGLTGANAQMFSLSYDGRFTPENRDTKTPSLVEHNISLSVPLYKSEKNTLAATLSGGDVNFSEPLKLSSGVNISDHLYRAEAGVQYSRHLEGKRNLGVRATFGYAGDKLNNDTQSFSINANYSFPGESGYWTVLVMMSNNSPLGTFVPIPGFFYLYKTSTFTGLFGLPVLSMQWTPVNPWAFSFSAFGPNLKSEVSYGAVDQSQLFFGIDWRQQRYLINERINRDDRLTLEEKTAAIGIRQPLLKGVLYEIQYGYLFDRTIYYGESLFDKDGGYFDLESNWFLKCSLKMMF